MGLENINAPWGVRCHETTNYWSVIVDNDGFEIGSTDGGFENHQAILMSKAPDLLEMLEQAVHRTELGEEDWVDGAKNLIETINKVLKE